jgi:capsular exopolysaccharide synthesis family protein
MSRIYEALKKVEREQQTNGRLTVEVDGPPAPPIECDQDEARRIAYERIQVWITNRPSPGGRVQAVMVAGCHADGGTTMTASRLAATLAQRSASQVVIVDANLRTPCLDAVFGARHAPGLSELLNGPSSRENSIQPTQRSNLFVITTGRVASSPSEVFRAAAVERLVSELKSRFDYVVFDAAPLFDYPDAYALAPRVDAVLLVVEAGRTPLANARRVARDLERTGAREIAVVLNRQRDYVPRFLRRFVT